MFDCRNYRSQSDEWSTIGLVHAYPDIFDFPDSKILPCTRYRICCGFFIFHWGEQIQKYLDSPDAIGRPQSPRCFWPDGRDGELWPCSTPEDRNSRISRQIWQI